MQNPTKGRGDAWSCYNKDSSSKIIAFPKHRCNPPTISDLVREYKSIRQPRGPYRTPMPDDWRVL